MAHMNTTNLMYREGVTMPRPNPASTAQAIRMVRAQLDWKQDEMGDAIGHSRQLIGKWEAGDSKPSVEQWAAILALPTDTDWLFDFLVDQLQGRAA